MNGFFKKTNSNGLPWYKQLWPWIFILLPASSVIASIFTVILFNQNKVSLVAEDYYKQGKAINQDFSLLRNATKLGITGELLLNENTMTVTLNTTKSDSVIDFTALNIFFQHRTLADKDINQMIQPDASGVYRFTLNEAIEGPWYIKVTPYDKSWALSGRASFPTSRPIPLVGKEESHLNDDTPSSVASLSTEQSNETIATSSDNISITISAGNN